MTSRRARNGTSDGRVQGGVIGDRPSRLLIFLKRQRRLMRPVLALLLLAILVAGGIVLLRRSATETDFAPIRARLIQLLPLHIATISVTGRRLTSEDALMQALGTSVGQPIFGFSVKAARDRIDRLPFVDHVVVERHMPDTVVVQLTERSPFAVWQDHGRFTLINRDGAAVADQTMVGPGNEKNAQAFLQLPLVVGDGANVAAGELIDALGQQPVVRDFVVAAVRVGDRRWNLSLKDGTTVMLPEGHDPEALARLARYQGDMRLLERPVISIDMRLPDRMVIHQVPAPDAPKTPDGSGDAPAGSTTATALGDEKPASTTPKSDDHASAAHTSTDRTSPPHSTPAHPHVAAPAPHTPSPQALTPRAPGAIHQTSPGDDQPLPPPAPLAPPDGGQN